MVADAPNLFDSRTMIGAVPDGHVVI